MNKFDYIVREAKEIFDHFDMNYECLMIDEILYNRYFMRRYISRYHHAFEENATKEVPNLHLIQHLFNSIIHQYSWIVKGNKSGFEEGCFDNAKILIEDEFTVNYERSLDDHTPREIDSIDVYQG